eukprot:scaffold6754_cov127-Skeletonema_dohrnii-CCMP3373.AAC.10
MIVLTKALASLLPSSKKIAAAACLSSNALPQSTQAQAFQLFRDRFWEDFAARHQAKSAPDLVPVYHLKMEVDTQPLTSISSDVHQPRDVAEGIHETTLQQRLDLFKHAHVKASYRCMKRGDGELSREYSLDLKKEIDTQPSLTSISSDVHQPRDVAEGIHETTLQQRLDLFKHAHVKASYRCMKRGDGELSREYSLGISINAHVPNKSNKRVLTDTPSLVDRRDWRKRMHHTFWEAYSSRKDKIASQASKVE